MESAANSVQLPPLESPHERQAVANELQSVLQELINLSLIGKQLHWTVVGPSAHSLHLFFDELAESWRELADLVAERTVTLGFVPDGQASTVAKRAQGGPVSLHSHDGHVAVWDLSRRVAATAEWIRSRLASIGQADLVTQDVLIDVVRTLEKQQWLLRVELGEEI